jgi:hypothetical protein
VYSVNRPLNLTRIYRERCVQQNRTSALRLPTSADVVNTMPSRDLANSRNDGFRSVGDRQLEETFLVEAYIENSSTCDLIVIHCRVVISNLCGLGDIFRRLNALLYHYTHSYRREKNRRKQRSVARGCRNYVSIFWFNFDNVELPNPRKQYSHGCSFLFRHLFVTRFRFT